MAMKIYTRTGDTGETALFGGGRVAKDTPRIVACGDVDELNASLGVVRATDPDDSADDLFELIQRDLFSIGGHLATPHPEKVRAALAKADLSEDRVAEFERTIDAATAKLPPLKRFILPGGVPRAAALHTARTVCRRAERSLITLSHGEEVPALFLTYLNRLSDLLFTLARVANQQAGIEDVIW